MTVLRKCACGHQESSAESRNPVERGLVRRPRRLGMEQCPALRYRRRMRVEIESSWTARRREQLGVYPVVRRRDVSKNPALSQRTREGRGTRFCEGSKREPAPDSAQAGWFLCTQLTVARMFAARVFSASVELVFRTYWLSF
jgi:hypothetical protein